MCAALAGFLRQSLAVGDLERHPLADELALAEREAAAAFLKRRFIAVRQRLDEIVEADRLRRRDHHL